MADIEGIVGVDEGGATKEGLRLAIQLFDAAYVFHDPGARTFHPKIYAVQNDAKAVVVVSSGNLTRGGLYTNYEGSVAADLDLDNTQERDFLEAVRAYYERLRGLGAVCRQLDEHAIEDLITDPSIVVVSEMQSNRQRQARRGRRKSQMFGGEAVSDLHDAPPPSIEPLPDEDEDDDILLPDLGQQTPPTGEAHDGQLKRDTATSAPPPIAVTARVRPVLAWWKRSTTSDAHRKPPTSHQRNYVALSKAGHNIAWHTWFREKLFGDLYWAQEPMRSGGTKEVAVVPFEVFIEDRHIGQYNLVVDHAEARIAGQNNTPTYLNWSSMLPVIKADDYRDWWLELARIPEDSFRLRLTRSEPSY